MGHPTIDEFCRVGSIDSLRPDFLRRCQREFRDDINPKLDELERLREENQILKGQLEAALTRMKPKKVEAGS